jgi:hypothetical protein
MLFQLSTFQKKKLLWLKMLSIQFHAMDKRNQWLQTLMSTADTDVFILTVLFHILGPSDLG